MLDGKRAVSPAVTSIDPSGTPSRSAQIWARIVS